LKYLIIKELRKKSIKFSLNGNAHHIAISLVSPFAVLESIRVEGSDGSWWVSRHWIVKAIRLEVRTGYLLYRAIRKLSLSRQGLISLRGGHFVRVDSTLPAFFRELPWFRGSRVWERDVVLVSITGQRGNPRR